MKKYFERSPQSNIDDSLLRKNASWHRLYFLQVITVLGGVLTILTIEMVFPIYLLSLIAGGLAWLIHLSYGDRKNAVFHLIYSTVWTLVCLLTLNIFGAFIALLISYAMMRVLILKGAIRPKALSTQ